MVKSGNDLTFAEAIKIGEKLDQTANSLKRAKRFRLAYRGTRIDGGGLSQEPTVKRLTIFSVTTDKNGDTTTKAPASKQQPTNTVFCVQRRRSISYRLLLN
ncbi:MAG: hypothetical protein R3D26_20585 [Cyanobacteriota/Melainabacteria group bacterium]